MALITIALAGYIGLGWFGLLYKKFSFGTVISLGLLWVVFYPISDWLQVSRELLFLFAVSIGASAYLTRFGLYHNAPFLLFLGTIGYYWYATGFLQTLHLFLLASIGSIVIQMPLRLLPNEYEDITYLTQISHGYIFSIIAYGNIILYYFLYGV